MRKSIFLIALAVSICFAGCGTPASDSSAPASSAASPAVQSGAVSSSQAAVSDQPVEISMAWWGGESRHEKFNTILDGYEAQNPNVTFVRQYSPWGDYWTKLTTQSASGALPDTFGMTAPYKNEFDARGAMEPLQQFVDSGILDLSDFTQGSYDAGSIDGVLKFVTFGDTVNTLMINKAMIDAAGMELPKPSMTYTEFMRYCVELQAKLPEGSWATNYVRDFELHTMNYGMYLVSDDGKEPGYTKEVLRKYYEFLYEQLEKGVAPPPEIMSENSGLAWGDSLEGRGLIALHLSNINQLKTWQAQSENEFTAVRGIHADDATHIKVEPVQPSGWAISPNSKVKEQVAAFLSFFVNDEETQVFFNMELGVPGSQKIQNLIVDNLGSTYVDNTIEVEVKLVQEILSDVEPYPGRKEGAIPLYDDVAAKWDEILHGISTIDDAVEAHFNNASTLLR